MRIALASLACSNVVPLGMLYVASALRRAGHVVQWCEVPNGAALVASLRELRSEAVGFGATTGMHAEYLRWAREVKRVLGIPTFMGGPHPTFVPWIVEDGGLDAICLGEAEESVVELVSRLRGGLDGGAIAGVWFKRGDGRVEAGPLRPPVADPEDLPIPAYDLIYDGVPAKGAYPVKPFLASRGCAHHCTYCGNSGYLALYGGETEPVRRRKSASVVEEIRLVQRRWGLDRVWLADASLLDDATWAQDLVGRIRREVGRPFFCKVRADHVDARAARMLAQAGCSAVGVGVESGSDRLRRRVLGRRMSNEAIISACRYLHEEGIRVLTFNMVGIPTETFEEALDTVDLNIACGADFAEATLLQPYPGTAIARWAMRKGHFDGDFDVVDYSYLSTSPFRYEDTRERDRLERLQKLLGLAVEFPEVRAVLPWLVDWPAPRLHDALFRIWYRWGFGTRIHGVFPSW